MRALLTVQPAEGHLHPLVPVARALSGAGHDAAGCMVPGLLDIAGDWGPDLIAREGMVYGGCIAAERLASLTRRSPATPTRRSTRRRSTTSRATAGWSPSRWRATASASGHPTPAWRRRSAISTCASPRPRGTGSTLASLGTVFNRSPGDLEAIVEALAGERVNLVVAIGRDSAERCAALGAGIAIGAADRTPEAIRAAVRAVLTTPG